MELTVIFVIVSIINSGILFHSFSCHLFIILVSFPLIHIDVWSSRQ